MTRLLKISIIIILIFVLYQLFSNFSKGQAEPVYIEHTVRAGESLWGIAKQYSEGQDIREVVYWIREDNDITPLIYPGQVILVRVD